MLRRSPVGIECLCCGSQVWTSPLGSTLLHACAGQDELHAQGLLTDEQSEDFVITYRAADVEPHCRLVLQSGSGPCRPLHVMGDITERSSSLVDPLHALLEEHAAKFEQKCVQLQGDGAPLTSKEKLTLKKEYGRQYLKAAWGYMTDKDKDQSPVLEHPKAWCFKCCGNCPVHPKDLDGRLYMVIGGNTCTSWSSMNQGRMMWLSPHTVPFVIWIADVMKQDIAFLIQECVRNFDVDPLVEMLSPKFFVQRVCFSPTHLGIPAHRLRSYVLATNKAYITVDIPWQLDSLEHLFWRQLAASADIYFRAPLRFLKKAIKVKEVQQAEREGQDFIIFSPELTLAAGAQRRLEDHIDSAKRRGLEFVCANIAQNVEHMLADRSCPVVLRGSVIWGVSLKTGSPNRLMTWYEQLGAQGVPVLLSEGHDLSAVVPEALRFKQIFVESRRVVSDRMGASLAGNGMHLSQVGLSVVVALLGCSVADTSSTASPSCEGGD